MLVFSLHWSHFINAYFFLSVFILSLSLSLFFSSFSWDLQEGKWHFCFTHLVPNSLPCILLVFKMYLWGDKMNGFLLVSAYFWFLLSYKFSLIRLLIATALTPSLWHCLFVCFSSRYGLVPEAGLISQGKARKKKWQPRLLHQQVLGYGYLWKELWVTTW